MSGYKGQRGNGRSVPHTFERPEGPKLISPAALKYIVEKCRQNPPAIAESRFLVQAATEGWRLDLPEHNGLIIGYDTYASTYWELSHDEDTVSKLHATILANTLRIDPVGDGK